MIKIEGNIFERLLSGNYSLKLIDVEYTERNTDTEARNEDFDKFSTGLMMQKTYKCVF